MDVRADAKAAMLTVVAGVVVTMTAKGIAAASSLTAVLKVLVGKVMVNLHRHPPQMALRPRTRMPLRRLRTRPRRRKTGLPRPNVAPPLSEVHPLDFTGEAGMVWPFPRYLIPLLRGPT